jgi:hypothetical protein
MEATDDFTTVNNGKHTQSMAPPTDDRIPLAEKFGHITVSAASFHLLLSFLLRQFGFLGSRDEKYFGKIVAWAASNLDQIFSMRNNIRTCIEGIVEYPTCGSAGNKVLGCRIMTSDEGEKYCSSRWYALPNKINTFTLSPLSQGDQNSTITLYEAWSNHLLYQICCRLTDICAQITFNSNCSYDFTVKDTMVKASLFFNSLYSQTNDQLLALDVFKKQLRETQQTPRSNRIIKREAPVAPKKQQTNTVEKNGNLSPRKLDFANEKEVTVKHTTNIGACKNATSAISYAKITKGAIESTAISTEETAVVDLNDESPIMPTVTEQPAVPTATEKSLAKAKKRAAQKKRKEDKLANASNEKKTDAVEIGAPVRKQTVEEKVKSNKTAEEKPETVVETLKPLNLQAEMVKMPMLVMGTDGKSSVNMVLFTKSDFAKIQTVNLV